MLIINGCGKSDSSLSQPFAEVGDNDGVVIETHPIDIIDINSDQIIESVNSYDNLNADNSLYVDIPESAPVLEFTERCAEGQNFEEYYKQYIEMFNYLFPNRELQDEYL